MGRKTLMSTATAAAVVVAAKAADTGAGAGDDEVVRKRVAKHELLAQDGTVLPDDKGEEDSWGIRYTLTENGQSVEYTYGKNAAADRMFACFGAKTLATNESSQARNSAKGAASADEQIAAVRERFALVDSGQWVDRTRDGVGAKVDLDALCEAAIRVQIRDGAKRKDGTVITAELAASGYKAELRKKLDDDPAYARKVRQVPAIATEYAAIKGRQTATIEDLAI